MDIKEFKQLFADNYVVVKLDVMESPDKKALENEGGKALMDGWGGEKSGIPFYVFLDPSGKKLADSNALPNNQNIGYPGEPQEIVAFEGLLKKTAPKMKTEDRNRLITYLKEHAPSH